MRRLRTWGVSVLAVALLAGCGGLSDSGPVQPGLEVGSGESSDLRVVFPGPQQGASPEEIVRGFIRAGAASDAVYDNARRFLTSSASESWNPDTTLVLLASDRSPTVRQVEPGVIDVSAPTQGTVDSTGRFTAAMPGATATARFQLVEDAGEWRIAELPDGFGRWLQQSDVDRLVQPLAVHYVSTSRRSVVPDVRWFPRDRLAPRLAQAQLGPVPDFLRGAAVTAVPEGARLLGDAVSVSGGVATVNLISSNLAPGESTRQNLWAQYVATLTEDVRVSAVLIAVDGVPVDLTRVAGPVSTLSQVGFVESAADAPTGPTVVRRKDRLSVYDPTEQVGRPSQTSPPAQNYPRIPVQDTDLAMSAGGEEFAAVAADGDHVSRWRAGYRYDVPGVGQEVGAPSYDRRGFLWFGAVGARGARLFTVDTRADPADAAASAPSPVRATWLAGRRVVEAKTAPGGDRIAVLSTDPAGRDPRIDLAGVVRGERGRPASLADPLQLGVRFSSLTGLVWLDDQSLATIAGIAGGPVRPTVLTVGGALQVLTEVPDAASVTAYGAESTLYVVTSKGRLVRQAGPRWVDSGTADALVAPAR